MAQRLVRVSLLLVTRAKPGVLAEAGTARAVRRALRSEQTFLRLFQHNRECEGALAPAPNSCCPSYLRAARLLREAGCSEGQTLALPSQPPHSSPHNPAPVPTRLNSVPGQFTLKGMSSLSCGRARPPSTAVTAASSPQSSARGTTGTGARCRQPLMPASGSGAGRAAPPPPPRLLPAGRSRTHQHPGRGVPGAGGCR